MSDFLTAIADHLNRTPTICPCGHPSVLHAADWGCTARWEHDSGSDPCSCADPEADACACPDMEPQNLNCSRWRWTDMDEQEQCRCCLTDRGTDTLGCDVHEPR